jgi:L-ascorbate metabolism protein UlaG (beta-lactamase superfamily)
MKKIARFTLAAAFASVPLVAACDKPSGDAAAPAASSSKPTASASASAAASGASSAVASAGASAAPSASAAATPPQKTDTFKTSKGDVAITPINHATFLMTFGGKAVYLDPVSSADYTGLPKADYVFITDIHPDHMDQAGVDKVKTPNTIVVGPKAVADKIAGTTVLANGEKKSFGAFDVEGVPMYNLTRGPEKGKLYHDKGRGDGFVFTIGGQRIYVSGDTECTPEMKALKNIDVAFVCMNLPYTMPPSEAAACIKAFKPKVVIPYHFKDSNLDELTSALKDEKGTEVRVRKWY